MKVRFIWKLEEYEFLATATYFGVRRSRSSGWLHKEQRVVKSQSELQELARKWYHTHRDRKNPDALFSMIEKTRRGCWIWHGTKNKDTARYGFTTAARAMHERLIGEVPKGKKIYMTCLDNFCVNPEHMLVMTQKEYADWSWKQKARQLLAET